ncbi:uncharacterized protein LOC133292166 [Gastrolobium bilobum]|uniref:uncharacterized protein LOC133292166 n=1 Tax=Gastrolobium bilobum TaxID=150636 RepID=UPI002AB0F153|nr:uncharacterized protein LOC133292166 [Gastrolobium bilobum]XP_061346526.1 uncharacterized protein LOC133292166 [Gastrolobium bilobum]
MENNSKMKVPKSRTLNENVSPFQIELDDHRGRYLQSTNMSPRFQPYAENIDAGSPLARYLFSASPISRKVMIGDEAFTSPTFGSSKYGSSRHSLLRRSRSPLSAIENAPRLSPPMYGTPVKVDDEVLVMDDILVRRMSGEKNGRSSSSSSGRGSSSSSKSVFKTDICRAWEESGNCRYNSKCQIAHGKELHPSRLSMMSKYEAQTSKSPLSAGSRIHGPSSQSCGKSYAAAVSGKEVTTSEQASHEPHHSLVNSNTFNDWSPLDDGIDVVLPNVSDKAPSREEVDTHIFRILYAPSTKRRLPVFEEICQCEENP